MSSKKVTNILAGIAILGVLTGFGVSYWISNQELAVSVPTSMKVLKNKQLLIATANDLLLSDEQGKLINKLSILSLGIEQRVVDIEQTPDGDYLLATPDEGVIFHCTAKSFQCNEFIRPDGVSFDIQAGTVHLASDTEAGLLYLANPWRQQVEKYNFKGEFLGDLSLDSERLAYPNDMWVLHDGRVAVADTNHFRIVVLGETSNATQLHNLNNIPLTFSVEDYPLSVVYTYDHKWWVIEGSEAFQSSWLVQYDESGKFLQRLALDTDDEPIMLGLDAYDMLLILSQATAKVIMVDNDNYVIGPMEEGQLHAYFADVRAEKRLLKTYLHIDWVILALSGLLVIYVAWRDHKGRPPARKPTQPAGRVNSSGNLGKGLNGEYHVSVTRVISEAWSLMAGHKGTIWIGMFAIIAITLGIEQLAYAAGFDIQALLEQKDYALGFSISVVIWTLQILLCAPISAGLILYCARVASGEQPGVKALFSLYPLTLSLGLVQITMTALIILGLLLLLIPGFYLSVAYMLALVLQGDRKLGVWSSLETSRKAVSHSWFTISILIFALSILFIISVLPLGIGIIWMMPMILMSTGILYRDIFGVETAVAR